MSDLKPHVLSTQCVWWCLCLPPGCLSVHKTSSNVVQSSLNWLYMVITSYKAITNYVVITSYVWLLVGYRIIRGKVWITHITGFICPFTGMGCSASVISVGLAQRLLRESPGKNALIVSTENITQNWCVDLIFQTCARDSSQSFIVPQVCCENRLAKMP